MSVEKPFCFYFQQISLLCDKDTKTDLHFFLQLIEFHQKVGEIIFQKRIQRKSFSSLPFSILLHLLLFTSTCNLFTVCQNWNIAFKGFVLSTRVPNLIHIETRTDCIQYDGETMIMSNANSTREKDVFISQSRNGKNHVLCLHLLKMILPRYLIQEKE